MAAKLNTVAGKTEFVLKKMGETFTLHQRWISAMSIVYRQRTGEVLKADTEFSPEDERMTRNILRDQGPPDVQ
jgi:hypothetical protein